MNQKGSVSPPKSLNSDQKYFLNNNDESKSIKQEEISQSLDTSQNINEILKKSRKTTRTYRFHSKASKCFLCGKQLSDRFVLYTHLKQVHNIKPHACKKCDQTFDSVKDLKTHIKTTHFKMTQEEIQIASNKKYIKSKVPNATKHLQKETEKYLQQFQKGQTEINNNNEILNNNNNYNNNPNENNVNMNMNGINNYSKAQIQNQRQLRRKTPPVQKNIKQQYQEEEMDGDEGEKDSTNGNKSSSSEFTCQNETGSSEDRKKKKRQNNNQKTKELLTQQLHSQHNHHNHHNKHLNYQQIRLNNHMETNGEKECQIKIIDPILSDISRNSQNLSSQTSTKASSNRIGIVVQSGQSNSNSSKQLSSNSNNINSSGPGSAHGSGSGNNSNSNNSNNNTNNEESSSSGSVKQYKNIQENGNKYFLLKELECQNGNCKYHNKESQNICEEHKIYKKRLKIQQDYRHYCSHFLHPIIEDEDQ